MEPREGVFRVRDDGCDEWSRALSIVLSPSHDCRLSDLVHDLVDRLEQRTGTTLQWSAWVHRDTDHPHAHLVVRADGLTEREIKHLARDIEHAAADAYSLIRERQREFARERERSLEMEP